ncbi:putative membrane protein [Sphingomonas vulcanisoli]|uniref:Membrane protein n=1 Tax=Sphingomonas vulcanisoli TaxID=1658060 RepID=A0ABX0TPA8_9SPHN|nr:TMEM175 family protein [Sphingomonas vulcanisoli]NIJ07366.1 putative membrane protein [Sphingomonas vulcanisoli]
MANREATVAHGPEHELERMIFFSDAVFAIAITLLVIDIHVPHLPHNAPDTDYWIALINLAPQFSGFFISFFVIGFFWAGHHRTMMVASRYAPSLNMPNMLLLSGWRRSPSSPASPAPIRWHGCRWSVIAAGC